MLERSDLYERDGKCQHAFCIDIDRDGDVRVLCNVRPSEHWMDTMLHEFGHAIYDRGLDPSLPWLPPRAGAHADDRGGSRCSSGGCRENADWLIAAPASPEPEARAAAAGLDRARVGRRCSSSPAGCS